MAYANLLLPESKKEQYRNTLRPLLFLDTRFANKLALRNGYKHLSKIPQFREVWSICVNFADTEIYSA